MRGSIGWRSAGLALLVGIVVPAHAANAPWEEYDKLINKASTVAAHGTTLFGDEVSLQSGALSFRVTDVSLPGNHALPVEITRTFQTETANGFQTGAPPRDGKVFDAPFRDWDLELPSISGVFATSTGWINPASGQAHKRCEVTHPSLIPAPGVSVSGISFPGHEIWSGTRISIPGRGSQALLLRTLSRPQPTAGGAYWITSDWTSVACLATVNQSNGGTGQGFTATTADGVKYRFDWMARTHEERLAKVLSTHSLGNTYVFAERARYAIYATRVEDRFGNWVNYTYTNSANAPVKLTRIESSDDRIIEVIYAGNVISGVQAHGKQWDYGYTGDRLTSVTLPDDRQWLIDLDGLKRVMLDYADEEPQVQWRACGDPGELREHSYTGTVTHPSGAIGSFLLGQRRITRTGLPAGNCSTGLPDALNDDMETYPSAWDAYVLKKKTLSGLGLSTSSWNYAYSSSDRDVTEVTGPGKYERHAFGNTFRVDEGKPLSVQIGSSPSSILRTTTYSYSYAVAGMPYLTPLGDSGQWRSDNFTEESVRPMVAQVTTQQGRDFIWVVDDTCAGGSVLCLDDHGRPTKVIKGSTTTGTTDLIPPSGTPTLTVTPALSTNGNLTASWTAVPYASSYQLQERKGSGAWGAVPNVTGISKSFSGKDNDHWSYQVRACNVQGCTGWSGTVTVQVAVPPSSAPVVSSPATSSSGNYSVTWGPVARATRYELDERLGSGAWTTIHNGSGTSKARSLDSGTYQYRARACNDGGCSPYSTVVTTVVNAPPQPPAAPASIYASSSSVQRNESFTVSWYASSGATSYELQRNRDQVGWTTLSPGSATSMTQSLSLGGEYVYRVRACNANGCGAYSNTTTVVVGAQDSSDPPDEGE